jgi:murein DD-endopeptidase MepM/ murein hydrolase activator NlpD
MTFYLHLSKIKVKVGDMVEQGEVIGLSGQTGYAYGPHLHLSVVINGVSIDPVKFFELLQ